MKCTQQNVCCEDMLSLYNLKGCLQNHTNLINQRYMQQKAGMTKKAIELLSHFSHKCITTSAIPSRF